MPEPKKTKRRYKAQANSSLDGLRLVQQRPARAAQDDVDSPPPGESPAAGKGSPPEAELVLKLIRFIKSI